MPAGSVKAQSMTGTADGQPIKLEPGQIYVTISDYVSDDVKLPKGAAFKAILKNKKGTYCKLVD